MDKAYLFKIINVLETKKTLKEEVDEFKHFNNIALDIDKYGRENVISTLLELESNPNIEINISWKLSSSFKKIGVKKFSIKKSNLRELYSIAGKDNKIDKIKEALLFYENCFNNENCHWLKKYYEDKVKSCNNGTIPKGFEDENLNLCLQALKQQNEPIYYRNFSVKTFKNNVKNKCKTTNSKIFETNYKKSIANIIKKYHPDANENMAEYELLELCNLYSYNQTFEYLGDLDLIMNNFRIVGTKIETGMIVNTKALRNVKDISLSKNINKVITIENKANFYSLEYNPEILYIYVHGFISPIEKRICEYIYKILKQDAIYLHWGDMDFGGINIYKYMKKTFPEIKPMNMSKDDYLSELNIENGYKISDSTRKKLELMDAGEECQELKEVILKYGKCFEQEGQL